MITKASPASSQSVTRPETLDKTDHAKQTAKELEAANLELKIANERLLHEIEERKWAEARLEIEHARLDTIFQSQPNWINICTLDSRIQEVNPAGPIIMEADGPEQLIGRSLRDFVIPEYQQEVDKCIANILQTGESHPHEVQVKTFRGNTRWLTVRPVLIHLDNDELRIMSIIIDHTDRQLAQIKLAERQRELAHIMRLNTLGEMASGIAHELNQPLSAIANYIRGCELRMQNSECNMESITEVMRLVSVQVKRAGEILRYAKDFTRKDQDIEWLELNISEIINDTLHLMETTEQFKQVKLIKNLYPEPLMVNVNKIQIEQVLVNMVLNALDSIRESNLPDGGTLEIRTELPDAQHVRVSIIDDGSGLPDGYEDKIFRPFYTSKKDGMGMGLPISSSIIEAHSGKLVASNNSEKGATFYFTLPIKGTSRQ
ncbi:MAG: PAS domain S-box protein [Gammaproteobacteria bacterium]|nr:PAS domain S-box protein [Gammaproteobacteria bacterium]MBU1723769.1 PAS domain S-box protein [Gammaproteobacteria bacterium]MBU2004839.1 PAS domain S-box protein [Gammaproteobacteria bacterium]